MAAEEAGFDDVELCCDGLMRHLDWTDHGKVLCGEVMKEGDIEDCRDLEEARALGTSM